MNARRTTVADRLLSASSYFGLAPLTRCWRARSSSEVVEHHFSQAMAAIAVWLVVLLAAGAWESIECLIYIKFPGVEEHPVLSFVFSSLDILELCLLLVFLPLFAALTALALLGSTRQVPLLKQLIRKRWPVQISFMLNSSVVVLIPVMMAFAVWATSLTRRSTSEAKVYFLYDAGIPVPRWGYAMVLCRICLEADRNWGKQTTVLDRLTKETLQAGLKNGRVLILATHGERGCAATYYSQQVMGVWPADSGARDEAKSPHFLRVGFRGADGKWRNTENMPVSGELQLAYIFACHAGTRASEWQEHLAPARVVTYNRFSTIWDHALWFAVTGPAELKNLK